VFAVILAMVAAIIVGTLTIDLGPSLKKRAETAASKYIDRPMHIGTLKILLLSGTFELDDVKIDGLRPEDRPFLTAKRIYVNLPWWTIFSGELIVSDVEFADIYFSDLTLSVNDSLAVFHSRHVFDLRVQNTAGWLPKVPRV